MTRFITRARSVALALAFALAIQPIIAVSTTSPALASKPYPMPVAVAGGGSTAGGWIIGGLFVSVASIITCAMIVGSEEGREMTLEEALLSGAIPLGCLFREHFAD